MKLVINGNFAVSVIRDNKSKMVKAEDGAFDFSADEIADIKKAHGDEALRKPINETPTPAKSEKSAEEIKAAQVATVKELMAVPENLNADGALKMDVLNKALKAASLPGMSAAERDAAVGATDL